MGGMLYKDFTAVKGKRILIILSVSTLVFLILRFVFPGSDLSETAKGTASFEFSGDFFLWALPLLEATVFFGLPSVLIKGLIAQDEKNKIMAFTKSLPFGKSSYIASKYVFLGVTVYAALSVSIIWCEIYFSRSGDNGFSDIVETLRSFLIILASASLLISGIELPFFLSLGSRRAVGVKTAVLELLFLFVIGWFFFGNLDVFENLDIFKLTEWAQNHEFEINIMVVLCPVIALTLYFLSYKLTCLINRNREADIDG